MRGLQKYFILWGLFLFAGCATPGSVKTETGRHALKWVQKVVDSSMPIETRQISSNGRTFYSGYFYPKGKNLVNATKRDKRYFAKVTILGDRRPYVIEVIVLMEHKVSGSSYKVARNNHRIAKALLKRIQKRLVKGRGKRNVIDDFRAF